MQDRIMNERLELPSASQTTSNKGKDLARPVDYIFYKARPHTGALQTNLATRINPKVIYKIFSLSRKQLNGISGLCCASLSGCKSGTTVLLLNNLIICER
jgi:hypothetical protein